jgi:hypothetical protein
MKLTILMKLLLFRELRTRMRPAGFGHLAGPLFQHQLGLRSRRVRQLNHVHRLLSTSTLHSYRRCVRSFAESFPPTTAIFPTLQYLPARKAALRIPSQLRFRRDFVWSKTGAETPKDITGDIAGNIDTTTMRLTSAVQTNIPK